MVNYGRQFPISDLPGSSSVWLQASPLTCSCSWHLQVVGNYLDLVQLPFLVLSVEWCSSKHLAALAGQTAQLQPLLSCDWRHFSLLLQLPTAAVPHSGAGSTFSLAFSANLELQAALEVLWHPGQAAPRAAPCRHGKPGMLAVPFLSFISLTVMFWYCKLLTIKQRIISF